MDGYTVFFDYENNTFPLPTNPEQIEVSSTQAISKYEILKLGQIAVPTHMELKEYSFECEFPIKRGGVIPSYVPNPAEYHSPEFFIKLFEKWRTGLVPVQFIAGRFKNSQTELESDSITALVLIEELVITEKAGEEGDKYISFKLLEYQEYGKVLAPPVNKKTGKKKKAKTYGTNPKNKGTYVVQSGDSLWSIAKKYYGDGTKYNIIYNANKDKIKNPNLIKAGQSLKIPSKDEFTKYSATLPVTKTSATTKSKVITLATQKAIVGERPIAGISLLLDSVSGRSSGGGGISNDGNTHSGGSRGF